MSASATSFSTMPVAPWAKVLRNLLYEISEAIELSNIQRMKGSSTNISTPLTRCRIDTQPAAGSRYVGRSVKALMLRNSGRFLASSVVMFWFLSGRACAGGKGGKKVRTTQNSIARQHLDTGVP